MYKLSNEIFSIAIRELFIANNSICMCNMRGKTKLRQQFGKCEYMYTLFSFSGMTVWNASYDSTNVNFSNHTFKKDYIFFFTKHSSHLHLI